MEMKNMKNPTQKSRLQPLADAPLGCLPLPHPDKIMRYMHCLIGVDFTDFHENIK